jgi:A/G-specific adenine glycosylase
MDKWLSAKLIKWYLQNKRDLPWRNIKDAYRIWLSEIILQQTQVAQGLSYYHRFVEKYPTIIDLATASEDEVLKLWQGLGYYSRARNLLHTANTVKTEYGGIFPSTYLEIRNLKGVGDYTAAAIASFAFGLPHAVVDGNVYRLLSRVFGMDTPIDSSLGKKQFFELANTLIDTKRPDLHNQAIMEFGSQYCKPTKPDCENCVLNAKCIAFQQSTVTSLPVKAKKTKVKNRYFNYLILANSKNEILINRRENADIWKGLYEFLLIESKGSTSLLKLSNTQAFKEICGNQPSVLYASKEYKHILSHQHLFAKFYVIKVKKFKNSEGFLKTNLKDLTNFAWPRLIEMFLNDCDIKEIV